MATGCKHKREWAPHLQLPERPVLQEIPSNQWSEVPRETRVIIADNMELVIQHTEALERTIEAYNEWQAGER